MRMTRDDLLAQLTTGKDSTGNSGEEVENELVVTLWGVQNPDELIF